MEPGLYTAYFRNDEAHCVCLVRNEQEVFMIGTDNVYDVFDFSELIPFSIQQVRGQP